MTETKTCQSCKAQFTIAPEDAEILRKLEVSEPQLCALCSLQRRLSWRNERHLYWRQCELCQKKILAMYAPTSWAQVYCRECWYSDKWDPTSYGRKYDPSRPFMEQYLALLKQVPHYNLWHVGTNENAEYTNYVLNARNCYLAFSCLESENIIYGKNTDWSRDCVDNYNVFKGELLYECVDVRESYNCAYLIRASKCTDCYLCRDCQDLSDCFGCVNLRHKKYCWFNEQLTKDEYARRFKQALRDRSTFEAEQKKFEEFALKQPVEYATIRASEGAEGDYVYNCKEARNCFDVHQDENVGDLFRVYNAKDSFRVSYFIDGELVYEYLAGPTQMRSIACGMCPHCSRIAYCVSCHDSEDLLGCIGLRKKKFCILNKQYSEAEYRRLSTQIVAQMQKEGVYGEFLALAQSPFPYNDTIAQEYFPLTKEEALARGWKWNDNQGGTRGQETIKHNAIASTIAEVPDAITKEILACLDCGLNYRIQVRELQLLRSLCLPLPLQCQECRFRRRLKLHNFPPLHHRKCMCKQSGHGHHADNVQCPNTFETTYSPNRPEVIYCNPCYQAEII